MLPCSWIYRPGTDTSPGEPHQPARSWMSERWAYLKTQNLSVSFERLAIDTYQSGDCTGYIPSRLFKGWVLLPIHNWRWLSDRAVILFNHNFFCSLTKLSSHSQSYVKSGESLVSPTVVKSCLNGESKVLRNHLKIKAEIKRDSFSILQNPCAAN